MSLVEATSLILLKGDHPLTSNIRQRCSASDQYWLHHSKSPLDKACLSFVQGSRKGQGSRKEKMSSRDWNKHNSYFKNGLLKLFLSSLYSKYWVKRYRLLWRLIVSPHQDIQEMFELLKEVFLQEYLENLDR